MAKVTSEQTMIAALRRRLDEAEANERRYRAEGNVAESKFWLGRACGYADALELLDQPFTR
jgi:hypothetical protein